MTPLNHNTNRAPRSVLDYWVDISELKEEDKISRVTFYINSFINFNIIPFLTRFSLATTRSPGSS